MSNFTLFTPESVGSQVAGTSDYVKDVFSDVSLPATNNTGLSSTVSTNPLSNFYNNSDAVRFGVKTLFIKDLVLIEDRSKWVSGPAAGAYSTFNKIPTYEIIWHETCPQAKGYVYGSPRIVRTETGGVYLTGLVGLGVGGVIRRAQFLFQSTVSSVSTEIDAAAGSAISYTPSTDADAQKMRFTKFVALEGASSNQTNNIHDFRYEAADSTTTLIDGAAGVVVYFENSGANIEVSPGTTYVDKTKTTTTAGATFAVPAFGSSLGGKSVIYKTAGGAYGMTGLAATMLQSIATGSSGTNLLTVTTGHGASFPAGAGIAAYAGSSPYIGSVVSVSTDTLTVSPTLPFGISGLVYKLWQAGSTYAINASLMELAVSIDAKNLTGITAALLDPQGRFALFGRNLGITYSSTRGQNVLVFGSGNSGILQVDGRCVAAEIELVGGGSGIDIGATVTVNGLPAYAFSGASTPLAAGYNRLTFFTEAGPGWNSFALQPQSASNSAHWANVEILRINLYERRRPIGVSFGALAEVSTQQTFINRSAINASLMAPGTYQRVYADQLPLSGSWVRGVTTSAAANVMYFGSSTNSSITFRYYGKNYAFIGTQGSSYTLTLDGASQAGVSFGFMQTVASEGFHTLVFTHQAGTCMIQAIDFTRSMGEVKSLQTIAGATTGSNAGPYIVNLDATSGDLTYAPSLVNDGETVTIKKTDSSTNKITIRSAIDGVFGRKLCTQNESVTLQRVGGAYTLISHYIPENWLSYTPSFVGLGTTANLSAAYRRLGDSVIVSLKVETGTPTATPATVTLPSGMTIDSAKWTSNRIVGNSGQSGDVEYTSVIADVTNNRLTFGPNSSQSYLANNADQIFTSANLSFTTDPIPITDWWG